MTSFFYLVKHCYKVLDEAKKQQQWNEKQSERKQTNKQTTNEKTNWQLKCYYDQISNTFDFRLIGN